MYFLLFCVHFTWIIFICVRNPYQMCTWYEHMQHQLGLRRCCALPASCRQEKYDHATLNKTRKRSTACCCSSISPQAFVKATFFVIFIQDVYVLSNPIIIHNNTSIPHFLQLALPQMYRYDTIYHRQSIFAKQVLDKSITTHKSRQYLTRSAAMYI